LRGIVNYAVGYNNIDLKFAAERSIAVTNTPGVLTETTADLAWALIFGVARRVVEADRFTRAGNFRGWAPELILGGDIYNKTLGIVGAGRIGSAVAKRAVGFGMKILYTSRNSVLDLPNSQKVELDYLLKNADFISLHLPLTAQTKHMITAKELKMMKPSAYLINTARGPIVDEAALVEALQQKNIAGAGLDVYEQEPQLQPGLAKLDNVILLPHLGSGTLQTRINMGMICLKNIKAIIAGEEPPQKIK
jgi:glyoxylate reductase